MTVSWVVGGDCLCFYCVFKFGSVVFRVTIVWLVCWLLGGIELVVAVWGVLCVPDDEVVT